MTQQLTGINSVMYYGTRILEESGMTAQQAVLANIAFGVVAVIGGIIALYNMDRLDRLGVARAAAFVGATSPHASAAATRSSKAPAGSPSTG